MSDPAALRVAAVVPCFRVRASILAVVAGLDAYVDRVFVVDDACPEGTGGHVRKHRPDVTVLTQESNRGVGAATVAGYRAALAAGFDLLVKVDGDGQMDPAFIPALLDRLRSGAADYAKGDRLFAGAALSGMPWPRRVGNRLFSRIARRMTGLPALSDPMNGFTAITSAALRSVPLDEVDPRWFFEADMLWHLARVGTRIVQVSMPARYGVERSNIRTRDIVLGFPPRIVARMVRRTR